MMAAENPQIQQMLQDGIQAIKRGETARGRDLLLQVVELDSRIEPAWLWLAGVVDDPEDQMTALENALALNPTNAPARKRLAELRARAAAAPPPPAEPVLDDKWKALLPESPQEEVDDGIDEPLQCVYCGRLTAEKDRACPHCGRKLYQRVQHSHQASEFLRLALYLMGIAIAVGLIGALGPLFTLSAAEEANVLGLQIVLQYGGNWLLGDFLSVPLGTAQILLDIHLLRAVLFAALLFGLSQRFALAYYAALVVLIADLLWNIFQVVSGYLGLVGLAVNGLFVLGTLALLFASDREFAVVEERLLTQPDTEARSAMDYYKRGHTYRKQGMWALAVAQWRRAVGLAPKEIRYYKDLGVGYAQIQRYQRSLRMLEEARRQAPNDAEIPHMIELVRTQAANQPKG